jgi:hypothetical protein
VRGGGDVEENHFIRALFVVAEREFDGVTDIAQFARLGLAELDAARDFAVMHVEAGYDSFGDHERLLVNTLLWRSPPQKSFLTLNFAALRLLAKAQLFQNQNKL